MRRVRQGRPIPAAHYWTRTPQLGATEPGPLPLRAGVRRREQRFVAHAQGVGDDERRAVHLARPPAEHEVQVPLQQRAARRPVAERLQPQQRLHLTMTPITRVPTRGRACAQRTWSWNSRSARSARATGTRPYESRSFTYLRAHGGGGHQFLKHRQHLGTHAAFATRTRNKRIDSERARARPGRHTTNTAPRRALGALRSAPRARLRPRAPVAVHRDLLKVPQRQLHGKIQTLRQHLRARATG